ncbi:hypothetical protein JB92DRAFT_404908 [Gautieria morchelliformis]|nr:hypothetical protein JB92DRAFT_404908 [Gautieria morchelliformis]
MSDGRIRPLPKSTHFSLLAVQDDVRHGLLLRRGRWSLPTPLPFPRTLPRPSPRTMTSIESTSPPPPVSSLRSRFEQIAAASSPPPPPLSSPDGPRAPNRIRSSSITDLKQQQQQFLDPKRIISGPADAAAWPGLRASPSSPDLKGAAKAKPAPPPPRGSRTPSPRPPSPGGAGGTVQPTNTKAAASFSRRPPPPPPPPQTKAAASRVEPDGIHVSITEGKVDGDATPSSGSVASLRSKFTFCDARILGHRTHYYRPCHP